MDYENDLEAPVWDDKVVPELSRQFAALDPKSNSDGLKEPLVVKDDRLNYEEVEEEASTEKASFDDRKRVNDLPQHNLAEALGELDDKSWKAKLDEAAGNATLPDVSESLFGRSDLKPLIDVPVINSALNHDKLILKYRVRPHKLIDFADTQSSGESHKDVDPLRSQVSASSASSISLDNQSRCAQTKAKQTKILDQMNSPLYDIKPREMNHNTQVKSRDGVPRDHEKNVGSKKKPLKKFNIVVKDPKKVGELTAAHVEYCIVTESDALESGFALVYRRYSHFRWLYRQLQHNHWGHIIPPTPEKQTVGRFKDNFVENRRLQIETMLNRIGHDPILQNDPDFLLLLTSENFRTESKKRELQTYSKASFDVNDLSEIYISEVKLFGNDHDMASQWVSKWGDLNSEPQKNFMGISFSSAPTYNEPDTFFDEYRLKVDALEERLRLMSKSLENLSHSKYDVADELNEFALSIIALADIDVSKKNRKLLSSFAAIQRNLKSTIERNSLQDDITMGASIDEWARSLCSVRAVLNQRQRLGLFLVVAEKNLNYKQAQLEKLLVGSKSKGNKEKMISLKASLNSLKNQVDMIRIQWADVGDTIKREVENFELERSREFRNSIEISLETSIETQKERIESWETFYRDYI